MKNVTLSNTCNVKHALLPVIIISNYQRLFGYYHLNLSRVYPQTKHQPHLSSCTWGFVFHYQLKHWGKTIESEEIASKFGENLAYNRYLTLQSSFPFNVATAVLIVITCPACDINSTVLLQTLSRERPRGIDFIRGDGVPTLWVYQRAQC